MYDVKSAKYLDDYKIEVTFDNGRSGIADFSAYPARSGIQSVEATPRRFAYATVASRLLTDG